MSRICEYEHENDDGTLTICENLSTGRTLRFDFEANDYRLAD